MSLKKLEEVFLERGMSNKDSRSLAKEVLQTIENTLKEEGTFALRNFGTFRLKDQKARTARNPKTGESIEVPARKTVSFKVSPKLKQKFNS